eukprot:scaffold219863_cov32-Tisochrysis_lutea.AAC.4
MRALRRSTAERIVASSASRSPSLKCFGRGPSSADALRSNSACSEANAASETLNTGAAREGLPAGTARPCSGKTPSFGAGSLSDKALEAAGARSVPALALPTAVVTTSGLPENSFATGASQPHTPLIAPGAGGADANAVPIGGNDSSSAAAWQLLLFARAKSQMS